MTNWKNRIVRQETVPISDIVPNAKNWRKHPAKQQTLGRKCRGMEIDPGYVAVILQRYKDTFPGKEIRLIE